MSMFLFFFLFNFIDVMLKDINNGYYIGFGVMFGIINVYCRSLCFFNKYSIGNMRLKGGNIYGFIFLDNFWVNILIFVDWGDGYCVKWCNGIFFEFFIIFELVVIRFIVCGLNVLLIKFYVVIFNMLLI